MKKKITNITSTPKIIFDQYTTTQRNEYSIFVGMKLFYP